MGNHLSCDAVDMQDTVSRYVSGHLSEEDATAFEQHMESCERCWGEVQVALQVRAATRATPDERRPPALRSRRWLAAAAAVVILAASAEWLVTRNPTPATVTRGSQSLTGRVIASRLPQGGVRVSWPRVESASRYRVVISQADGSPILTQETEQTEVVLPQSFKPAGAALLIELRAEDGAGTPLLVYGPASVGVSAAESQ